MKLYTDLIHYQPWCGARETYALIEMNNKLDELDNLITELYPEGLSMTGLNDILWFDSEWVLGQLGIEDDDNDTLE